MRKFSVLISLLVCASLAFSQDSSATPPKTPSPSTQNPAAGGTSVKPHGPEAVADRDPGRVVATIDGQQITAKQALDFLKPFPPEQRKQYEANLSNLVQQVYMRIQLADLAAKMNLDKQSPWKDQVALARDNVLAQAYLNHLSDQASKGQPVDAQKYYDSHPDEFDQVKLSGIFVSFTPPGTPASAGQTARTEQDAEAKANDIEKQLKSGGDFSALARTSSDNQAAASKGGDLGTVNMGDPQLPPVLKTAIGKLQTGQYSEPLRVQNALLILRLDSRQKQPFTEVQKTLEDRLKGEQSQNVVKAEVEKYKIKVEDPDFFEAPSAHPVPSLQRQPSAPAQPSPEK